MSNVSDFVSAHSPPTDLPWHVVERWQEFLGESRANVLRIVAVGVFYLIELATQQGIPLPGLDVSQTGLTAGTHRAITLICSAWIAVGLGVLLLLRNRIFPRWLKFATTGCDLFLLTLVLMAGTGSSSPMVAAYFVIVALAGLRFHLRLVQATTTAALASYIAVNVHAELYVALNRRFGGVAEPVHMVSRYHQIQTLLAIVIVGIVVGQIVRQVRRMAMEYRERSQAGS